MKVLAIDPGTTHSQYVLWDGLRVLDHAFLLNDDMRFALKRILYLNAAAQNSEKIDVSIEMVASYGMPVGAEVFETCVWIGRFIEGCARAGVVAHLVYRKDVKMHLCHTMKAKDANIRQAILDRFGGKDAAIGVKSKQGPLYGVSGHAWAALAIALMRHDQQCSPQPAAV